MARLPGFLSWGLSSRRKRFWRFVSPRRHGLGLLTLALLVAGACAYAYFTNDHRIARQAERYLHDCTGWRVQIRKASFSIFNGIELQGLRAYAPGETQWPLLEARKVQLRIRPMDLVWGDCRPAEVVCDYVNVADDILPGADGSPLTKLGGRPQSSTKAVCGDLPIIRVRWARLQSRSKDGVVPEVGTPLNLTLMPAGPTAYHATFEKVGTTTGEGAFMGRLDYDLATGATTNVYGEFPGIQDIHNSLPPQYRKLIEPYNLRGAKARIRQLSPAGGGKLGSYEVSLIDLSLKLPAEQGGMDVVKCSGTMVFGDDGIEFRGVTGKLVQAGNGSFRLDGRYRGYDAGSAFDLNLHFSQAALPSQEWMPVASRKAIRDLTWSINPKGPITSIDLALRRGPGGRIELAGEAAADSLTMTFGCFPYVMTEVRGKCRFTDKRLDIIDTITAKHGGCDISMSGDVDDAGLTYHIKVKGFPIAFDKDLKAALPPMYQEFWDLLKPTGQCRGSVSVDRDKGDRFDRVAVDMGFEGKAGMTYRHFPYAIDELSGHVRIADGNVTFDNLRGRHGQMTCDLGGTIKAFESAAPAVDLDITARNLPIDKAMLDVLAQSGRKLPDGLEVAGMADRLNIKLMQEAGKSPDYTIKAYLSKMAYHTDAAPYRVTDGQGVVVVRPDAVEIQKLQGRHDRSVVMLGGKVYFEGKEAGPGVDLSVAVGDATFDDELLAALPAEARAAWKRLSPSGTGDITLNYRRNLPGQKSPMEYDAAVTAKDMQFRCPEFPYTFRNVSGVARFSPGKVTLDKLRAGKGDTHITASGTLADDGKAIRADLAIQAGSVPVDADLLAALPKSALPVIGLLQPGGTCGLDVDHLRIAWMRAPADGPAASKPAATAPADSAIWSISGSVMLSKVTMDLGFGTQSVSGKFTGSAGMSAGALAVDTQASLESIELAGRKVTDFGAKMSKQAASETLVISDMGGKLLGGRMAGAGEVTLGQPAECEVRMEVHDLKLADIYASAVKGDNKAKVEGNLKGSLRLRAKVGKPAENQAEGEVYITEAKVNQMPVLLGIQQVLVVPLPGDSIFTDGVIRYELKGQDLLFNEIHLNGAALSIVGSGKVDMKTEGLTLSFLGRLGGKLPRIDGLDALVTTLARELSEIRVTGSISKPLVRNVPMGSLEDFLRRVANPAKD